MASLADVYGSGSSDHLKAEDIKNPDGTFRVIQATIESFEVVNFAKEGDKDQFKIVLSLVGKDKSVVMNVTNAGLVGAQYGADYTTWPGKDVIITGSPKKYNGNLVPGIDVTPILVPEGQQAKEYAATAEPPPADYADEDVPF